ncbi:radical SAM protein [Bryobacterales bacterium F-183]|nr:radical SAM protein [Bryobacterales bacterium F-183]
MAMAGLVGIAKLAAASGVLEEKSRVEYRDLESRSYITRCSNPNLPFQWTINPYRGCEYGCKYCYARYTHEFMELRDPQSFETRIFAKKWNRAEFIRELRRVPFEQGIAMGTATDPYQPAERRFGLTRKMLEAFAAHARHQGLWITTKSDLAARDVDIFTAITANRNHVSVNITITTLDTALARALEPYAPRPDLRLNAVRQLAAAGVHVCVNCSPVMPLINDSESSINAVAQAAKDAGAKSFWSNVVFLKPCAAQVFFPFLEDKFPAAVRRYRAAFGNEAYLKGPYLETLGQRVQRIRERHGFHARSRDEGRHPAGQNPQMQFSWE